MKLRDLLARHEPRAPLRYSVKAGLGALIAILILGVLLDSTGLPLLLAPFGASTVLLFGRPRGTLAQPVNVVAGYTVSALVAYGVAQIFPGVLWATGASIGLSLVLMRVLRVTHPPAGAIPLIAFGDTLDVLELLEGVVLGSVILVAIALVWHRIPPQQEYPKKGDADAWRRNPLEDTWDE